jgi:hypothetical protein
MRLIPVLWLVAIAALIVAIYKYLESRRLSEHDGDRWNAQIVVAAIVATIAVGSTAYRVILGAGLGQTAALFIGIPAILALATIFTPVTTAIGVAFKSVTIGLLVSLIFLDEGVVCVLMSAPLFYLIAYLVALAVADVKSDDNSLRLSACALLCALAPMTFEGTTPVMTIGRAATVSETRIVDAPADAIAAALHQQPRFDRALPAYLAIGFPRPTSTRIDGNRWIIRMRGGEMRLNGLEPRAGDLVLEKDGAGPGWVSWRAVSDDSHMTHFLDWRSSRVEWQAVDSHTTRVTWTLGYERGLDPAWYFGPMERYAMWLAAGYLIESVATP